MQTWSQVQPRKLPSVLSNMQVPRSLMQHQTMLLMRSTPMARGPQDWCRRSQQLIPRQKLAWQLICRLGV